MFDLAHPWTGGPGPWFLLFPLFWAAVVFGVITLLRRTVWRGRGPWQRFGGSRGAAPGPAGGADPSPIDLLARRFATGEIDEDEYWRRLSVLDERFGAGQKGGAV
ncbi:SHOCT domain-containing protein [Streptomyces rimosus]|uniref:SHOCT domain-containing protein n=1 Tax=Streptomyces rimosus TaxID=1927 RepID=UPI0004C59066|nr:membrane protein [Streptomyces rimosus]